MFENKLHVCTYSSIRFTLRFVNLFVEVSRVCGIAPPILDRSFNPKYLNHKGILCSPLYHLPPWFFRLSYGHEQHKVSAKIPKWLASIWTLADVSNQRLSQGARTIHHSFQVDKWNEIGSDKASPEVNCARCQLLFEFIDSFGSLHNLFLQVSGKNDSISFWQNTFLIYLILIRTN